MKTPIIAANWKMNKTASEAVSFLKDFKPKATATIIICPPFTSLESSTKSTNIPIGAQNCSTEEEGALTGEISPKMLKALGVKYVIIGHSERRHILNETNQQINKKLKVAINNNLIPIFCVGETEKERLNQKTKQVLKNQLKVGLKGIKGNLIIAYEPVWAIGTGKTATPEIAEEAHQFIRSQVPKSIPLLYGGSVKPENIKTLMQQPNIDGALVGGASLNPNTFAEIIKNAR